MPHYRAMGRGDATGARQRDPLPRWCGYYRTHLAMRSNEACYSPLISESGSSMPRNSEAKSRSSRSTKSETGGRVAGRLPGLDAPKTAAQIVNRNPRRRFKFEVDAFVAWLRTKGFILDGRERGYWKTHGWTIHLKRVSTNRWSALRRSSGSRAVSMEPHALRCEQTSVRTSAARRIELCLVRQADERLLVNQ
ncbi:hypothetical protein ACVWZZ_006681 [Bradyrhizobium sp. LM6.10]